MIISEKNIDETIDLVTKKILYKKAREHQHLYEMATIGVENWGKEQLNKNL